MEYKLRIIAEANACKHAEFGALLQTEKLYSNELTDWRREFEENGDTGGTIFIGGAVWLRGSLSIFITNTCCPMTTVTSKALILKEKLVKLVLCGSGRWGHCSFLTIEPINPDPL